MEGERAEASGNPMTPITLPLGIVEAAASLTVADLYFVVFIKSYLLVSARKPVR